MKYDLAKMRAEIERDERVGRRGEARVLTQAQIKELARGRRRRRTDKAAPQK
jgi:hypothetical protein